MNMIYKLKNGSLKPRVIAISVFGVLVVASGLIGLSSKQPGKSIPTNLSSQNNDEVVALLAGQLSDIQTQISNLKVAMDKPQRPVNIEPIKQEIGKLARVIALVKSQENTGMKQLIGENKALAQKVQTVRSAIEKLNETKHAIKYLEPSSLPFRVLAIDNIQEQSVVAILYNYHPMALEKGDDIAGWKVVSIDYSQQVAEFENKDKAHVQLSLTKIG